MSRSVSRKGESAKYLDYAEKMRARVRSGALEPGERLPSFQTARERYGLSQSTVERAYAVLEEEGLVERRPYSGIYVTQPKSRATTGVIAVLNPLKQKHSYYMHLLQGVQDAAHKSQVEVLLVHDSSTIGWDKVDGVISCDLYPESLIDGPLTLLRRLPAGMPHVRMMHPGNTVPCVKADDYTGIKQAVSHLAERGHSKIAYLTMGQVVRDNEILRSRIDGYHHAMRECGLTVSSAWLRPAELPPEPVVDNKLFGYTHMSQWLRDDWEELGCTAILAHNDDTALGIIDALTETGKKVPDDVSVMGFDGLDYYHPACGPLVSVRVPLYEIGLRAAQILIEKISGTVEAEYGLVELPTEISPGDSVALVTVTL